MLKAIATDNRGIYWVEFWARGEMVGITWRCKAYTCRIGWDCRDDTFRNYLPGRHRRRLERQLGDHGRERPREALTDAEVSGRSSPQKVYRNPLYYEVAFSFIDPKKQVALYERLIRRYSNTKGRRCAELGCGPGLVIREFARRDYRAVGLDKSRPMLAYLEHTAKDEGVRVEPVLGDMTDFRLGPRADFVMLLMGSVEHIPDRERMQTHLESVAASLKRGGLYLVENYRLNWAWETLNNSVTWEMERDGVGVKTRFKTRVMDVLNQRVRNELRLNVNDHGKSHLLREQWDMDLIFGPEFEAMVASTRGLEFVGWFERFRLQRLKFAKADNIGLIRKTRG